MAKKIDKGAEELAARIVEADKELAARVASKMDEALDHYRTELDADLHRLKATLGGYEKSIRRGYDLATKLAKDGRIEDALALRDILIDFKSSLEAQRGDAGRKDFTNIIDATDAAMKGHFKVKSAVNDALRHERGKRHVANKGRNGPRKTKYDTFRDAIKGKVADFDRAKKIVEELMALDPDLPVPSDSTIYSWLPVKKSK